MLLFIINSLSTLAIDIFLNEVKRKFYVLQMIKAYIFVMYGFFLLSTCSCSRLKIPSKIPEV